MCTFYKVLASQYIPFSCLFHTPTEPRSSTNSYEPSRTNRMILIFLNNYGKLGEHEKVNWQTCNTSPTMLLHQLHAGPRERFEGNPCALHASETAFASVTTRVCYVLTTTCLCRLKIFVRSWLSATLVPTESEAWRYIDYTGNPEDDILWGKKLSELKALHRWYEANCSSIAQLTSVCRSHS